MYFSLNENDVISCIQNYDKDQTGGMNVFLKSSCFQPQNQTHIL